jgi:hypothetical protein
VTTQFSRRLSYATAAVAAAWLVSGVIFVSLIRGPGTVAAWLIWATGVFATAWSLVALPIVALGDRILRMGVIGLSLAAGTGGVSVIELPYLITRVLTPRTHYIWSVRDLVWPGLAFGAGVFAGWVYGMLLSRAPERN